MGKLFERDEMVHIEATLMDIVNNRPPDLAPEDLLNLHMTNQAVYELAAHPRAVAVAKKLLGTADVSIFTVNPPLRAPRAHTRRRYCTVRWGSDRLLVVTIAPLQCICRHLPPSPHPPSLSSLRPTPHLYPPFLRLTCPACPVRRSTHRSPRRPFHSTDPGAVQAAQDWPCVAMAPGLQL